MINNKKIGLVLGGGGARGVSHIGILRVLEEAGVKPDLIAGCSIGAMIGAAYALGKTPLEMEEFLDSLKPRQIARLLSLAQPKRALIKGDKGFKFLDERLYKHKSFDDCKIPLRIVSTNLGSGSEKIFKDGPIITAVQASTAVPGILPPVKIGERYYIDGGVVNPTPIDIAKNEGMDMVIGVDLIMKKDMKMENPNIITTLLQAYEIIRTEGTKHKIATVTNNIVMIEPDIKGTIESFKFNKIPEFIEAGTQAAQKALPEIKKKLGI